MTILAACFTGWLEPFRIAYLNIGFADYGRPLTVLSILMLAIFCADIVISFFVGFYDKQVCWPLWLVVVLVVVVWGLVVGCAQSEDEDLVMMMPTPSPTLSPPPLKLYPTRKYTTPNHTHKIKNNRVMQHGLVVRHYAGHRLLWDLLTTIPWDVILLNGLGLDGSSSVQAQ